MFDQLFVDYRCPILVWVPVASFLEGGVVSQVFRQEDDEAANLRISSADMGGEKKNANYLAIPCDLFGMF